MTKETQIYYGFWLIALLLAVLYLFVYFFIASSHSSSLKGLWFYALSIRSEEFFHNKIFVDDHETSESDCNDELNAEESWMSDNNFIEAEACTNNRWCQVEDAYKNRYYCQYNCQSNIVI